VTGGTFRIVLVLVLAEEGGDLHGQK